MLKNIQSREIRSWRRDSFQQCRATFASRLPPLLREQELHLPTSYDKVFASSWIDSSTFVLGTKCNKLIRYDAATRKHIEIPLPETPLDKRKSGPDGRQQEHCGIHSIATNPSATLLASGADSPDDVVVFQLPSFEPVKLFSAHTDWMFGCAWVTETHLITGSRDSTLKLWSVGGGSFVQREPIISKADHQDKVRDLKYSQEIQRLASLSHDSTCKVWDPHFMEVVHSVPCPEKKELVCIAVDKTLGAIGSQRLISFIDLRCGHIIRSVASADEAWGVRSLSFRDQILTCGGGKGRISFLDMRTLRYIPIRTDHTGTGPLTLTADNISHNTGRGHVVQNDVYRDHFANHSVQHAVYTHSYDPSGTSLLVAGGPLPFGLKGCYAALW